MIADAAFGVHHNLSVKLAGESGRNILGYGDSDCIWIERQLGCGKPHYSVKTEEILDFCKCEDSQSPSS